VQLAVRFNPLSYGVDGLRGALNGGLCSASRPDFTVLGSLAAILLAIGAYLFSKIEVYPPAEASMSLNFSQRRRRHALFEMPDVRGRLRIACPARPDD
jgi:hypothetical protein